MTDFLIKTKDYIQTNKEWIFSGIGILVITTFFTVIIVFFKKIFKKNAFEIKTIETSLNQFIKKEEIGIYSPRGEFDDYITFVVTQAKKKVILLSITFGFVSYPRLEKLIEESNILFDFYILNEKSDYFIDRKKDINRGSSGGNYLLLSDINNLIKLKNKFIGRVNIYLYDSYPFWHYIFIDDKKLFISHHPLGSLGYNSCNVLEVKKDTSFDLFKLHYNHLEIIKKESKKL